MLVLLSFSFSKRESTALCWTVWLPRLVPGFHLTFRPCLRRVEQGWAGLGCAGGCSSHFLWLLFLLLQEDEGSQADWAVCQPSSLEDCFSSNGPEASLAPHRNDGIVSMGQDLLQLQQREAALTPWGARVQVCSFFSACWSLSLQGAAGARPFPGSASQHMPLVLEVAGNSFSQTLNFKNNKQTNENPTTPLPKVISSRLKEEIVPTSTPALILRRIYFYNRQIKLKILFLHLRLASSGAEALAQEPG